MADYKELLVTKEPGLAHGTHNDYQKLGKRAGAGSHDFYIE